jgi:hypothetical protein
MSTPIYKVSDGSTITFKILGPNIEAILTTPNGQVIQGQPISKSTNNAESKLAKEILLSNNIVDPNSGEPLPYTIEGPQDQSNSASKISNAVFEIPKIVLEQAPDQTRLATNKINSDITKENSNIIKSNVNSSLSPKVRLTNVINQNRISIQQKLIPFVLTLLSSFGGETIQAIVLNKNLPLNDILELIDCPSQNKINKLINQRNKLAKQINNIYEIIKTMTVVTTGIDILIKIIEVAIIVAKANPYPSIGVPPAGLPPLTAGIQNTLADALRIAQEENKTLNLVLDTVTITLASFGVLLGVILELLGVLDKLLQHCSQIKNMDLEAINNEINSLSNSTLQVTQNSQTNNNTYKGFKLEVVVNTKNKSKAIQRYAQAVTPQGVPVLKTEPSFASDPQVLIDQLKFIIDSNPNLIAE